MSKVITSPVKHFAGTVTLPDVLFLPQAESIDRVYLTYSDFKSDVDKVTFTQLDAPKIHAIVTCVEKWELSGFPEKVTVDNFPMSPKKARRELVDWLWAEIEKVYDGEQDIPNE